MNFVTIPPHHTIVRVRESDDPKSPVVEIVDAYVGVEAPSGRAVGTEDGREFAEGESVTLEFVRDLLRRFLLLDQSWGKDVESLHASQEIRGAFVAAVPGDVVPLETALHKQLADVARKPSSGFNPAIGGAMIRAGFLSAILDAPSKDPRKVQ